MPSSPPGSTVTENPTPSLQGFNHKPTPCPSTASEEIISNFWGLAVLQCRTFAVITHLSLLPRRVRAEERLLRRVLLLLVCQNGRVDVPPDLREDVLLHPPSQKGKMIATEPCGSAFSRDPSAVFIACRRRFRCFEVNVAKSDLCVQCGSFPSWAGSSRGGSAASLGHKRKVPLITTNL